MIHDILNIGRGITAVIGSGGKTSLINRLARELAPKNRVIICTTTKILRPENMPVILDDREAVPPDPVFPLCVGTMSREDPRKLTAPRTGFDILKNFADHILVEADGSRHLPAKAHLENEPVIPDLTDLTLLVIGAECFGKPIRDVVHRPDIFAGIAGVSQDQPVSPRILAGVISAEKTKFGAAPIKLIINRTAPVLSEQFENDLKNAAEIKELTGFDTYTGAVVPGILQRL